MYIPADSLDEDCGSEAALNGSGDEDGWEVPRTDFLERNDFYEGHNYVVRMCLMS